MDRLDKRKTHNMFLDVSVLGGGESSRSAPIGAKTIGPGKHKGM